MTDSPKVYRVKDWNSKYENNRTRELKRLDWVPVPNHQDTYGYGYVLSLPNGPALFGAWMAMLQVASKCGIRGTLLRDGATPYNSASLALVTRFPEDLIQQMLDVFSSDSLQWLEVVDLQGEIQIPQQGAEIPHVPDASRARAQGREGKGREEVHIQPADQKEPYRSPSTGEVVDLEQAIAISQNVREDLKPDQDFVAYVHGIWYARGGKDGSEIPVDWKRYIAARWSKERLSWKDGTHSGRQQSKPAGGQPGAFNSQPRESSRNVGTRNEGKGSQYAGIGRLKVVSNPGGSAT
jgi:hypothetical protein